MRRRLPLLPCYLLVVLTPAPAGQERTRREPITSEQSEVFALLDKFDSLDTSKHPFIQITWSRRDHGGLWKRRHRYGFLLGARGRQFRARFVELGKATLDFPQPDEDASCRVTFKPFSLAAFARGFVAERSAKLEYIEKHPERPVENWFHLSQSNPAPPEIVLLLVARACARRGLTADMNAVWNALPQQYQSVDSLRDDRGLAGAFRARLVLDFHDTSYTWQDLLARHDTWLESFPRSSDHDAVQRTRTGIKKVLEIERELSRATADLESGRRTLAEAERIRALVLNLRNERFPYAHRLVLGARDIHPEEPVSTDGTRPIDRLRAEGLKAVPALIDALGDRTLTRSLGYSSRLGNSDFRVLELGRLAEDALIGISGAPVAVAAGEQRKQAWQTWLETARTRGIQATHARLIHRDGYLSFRAARSYVDRWPEDLDVILRAIESSPRAADTGYQYQRYSLLEHIARKTRDPRVNALLRTDLENTTAMFRWWAADILLGQGDRAWIAKLVRHWQRTRQPMVIGREDAVGSTPERVVLVGILMRCGDPEAWNALGAAMDSPVIRLRVLQGLQSTPRDVLIKHVAASDREAVDATLERILVGLLADDEPRIGLSPTWRSSAMHAASFADIAACALAHYWPHRYQFDPAQTASVRRRQIVHLRNAHRQEGEPLTPLPPLVPRVVRSDDPAIETLLQRIREAASGWRDDVQQLAGIGQGALPGMIDTLDELPANRQTSKALAAAALNLSNRIAEVAFGASAKEIPQSLRQQATSLRGQQVSEKLLWSLLIDVSHSASRRERAGRVHLERTGAGGGFSVRIEMPSEQPRGEGSSYDQSITAAGVGITYGSWSATQAKIDDAASIDDQGAGAYLRDALATPAGKGVEISLTLQLY